MAGKRAYDLARSGKEPTLQLRKVRVDAIDIERYFYPKVELKIACGKGTYIRSIARDIGEQLGCGAYVEILQRTAIGHFDLSMAKGIDELLHDWPAGLQSMLMAMPNAVRHHADSEVMERIRCGQIVKLAEVPTLQQVTILDKSEQLIAIGETDEAGMFRSSVVLVRSDL